MRIHQIVAIHSKPGFLAMFFKSCDISSDSNGTECSRVDWFVEYESPSAVISFSWASKSSSVIWFKPEMDLSMRGVCVSLESLEKPILRINEHSKTNQPPPPQNVTWHFDLKKTFLAHIKTTFTRTLFPSFFLSPCSVLFAFFARILLAHRFWQHPRSQCHSSCKSQNESVAPKKICAAHQMIALCSSIWNINMNFILFPSLYECCCRITAIAWPCCIPLISFLSRFSWRKSVQKPNYVGYKGLPFPHQYMSHRGGALEFIENTMPGFRYSGNVLKSDILELDVMVSYVVLMCTIALS